MGTPNAAPLPPCVPVETRSDWWMASFVRAGRTIWQRYLDVFLGLVLVVAGVLKGQQLLVDSSVGRATGFPREALIGAAAFELAFGCWLVTGSYRRMTRWIALGWFTCLAAVALAQAVGGVPFCTCLGELHMHAWLMFGFDVLVVLTLWMWSPHSLSSCLQVPAALCLSSLPAVALVGLLGMLGLLRNQPFSGEIELGDIVQGGEKQQAFHIRNDSGMLMEVAVIETSCPCASISLERDTVATGQFVTGNVTLNLRSQPDFVGDLAIEAKCLTGRGRVACVLQIRARVHPTSSREKRTV